MSLKEGIEDNSQCINCGSFDGRKLTKQNAIDISYRFFVAGTMHRGKFGGAPRVQFNEHYYQKGGMYFASNSLNKDMQLLEEKIKIGFFPYEPRLWMIGEIEPLIDLQIEQKQFGIIQRVLKEYPTKSLSINETFYRVRICPSRPDQPEEYDSPPFGLEGNGRLDSKGFPVMYCSQDIDVCIHECRASAEDDIYVATLRPKKTLNLLDLTHALEENTTELESLDLAIHMLFLSRSHSYDISRKISKSAHDAGFDGIIYPSFFSLIRTGGSPFESIYGLSVRLRHPERQKYIEAFTIRNMALFGRPIEDEKLSVDCINRIIIEQVGYHGHLGPVHY